MLHSKVIFKSMTSPDSTGQVDHQVCMCQPSQLKAAVSINLSNAGATFVQSTNTQRFLKKI